MPNWTENRVKIYAPTDEVKTWLIPAPDGKPNMYRFNMHRLFPEYVPADDPCGETRWSYGWYVENTGSKWSPEVYLDRGNEDETRIVYLTAWSPNNPLLKRLHELTGWSIVNDYEEPGMRAARQSG